jgi:hypothetical protein
MWLVVMVLLVVMGRLPAARWELAAGTCCSCWLHCCCLSMWATQLLCCLLLVEDPAARPPGGGAANRSASTQEPAQGPALTKHGVSAHTVAHPLPVPLASPAARV